MGIALLILTGVNWVIYHKIFRFYYFGNAGQSIFKEIFGCSLVAVIELAIIIKVGGTILSALLVIGAIILGITLGTYVVYKIYKFVKGRNGEASEKEPEQEPVGNGMNIHKEESAEGDKSVQEEQQKETQSLNKWFCANCGKPISKNAKFCMFCGAGNISEDNKKQILCDVELTEVGPNKVKIIGIIRELTGFNLEEAKEFVDSAPELIKKAVPEDEAGDIKTKLEEKGAKVTIRLLS